MRADPADFACTCTEPHYVYRCFDKGGALIYIGVARDVRARLANHKGGRGNKGVATRTVRVETTEYPDRAHALAAEAQAIFDEAPELNVRHNGKRVHLAGRKVEPTFAELEAAVAALPSRLAASP